MTLSRHLASMQHLAFGESMKVGLSTQVLKPDSLDPDPPSGFNAVLREFHLAYRLRPLHCWTGSHALSWSTVVQHCMQLESYRGRMEAKWSLDSDFQYASDLDPRSHVESPTIFLLFMYIIICPHECSIS